MPQYCSGCGNRAPPAFGDAMDSVSSWSGFRNTPCGWVRPVGQGEPVVSWNIEKCEAPQLEALAINSHDCGWSALTQPVPARAIVHQRVLGASRKRGVKAISAMRPLPHRRQDVSRRRKLGLPSYVIELGLPPVLGTCWQLCCAGTEGASGVQVPRRSAEEVLLRRSPFLRGSGLLTIGRRPFPLSDAPCE